MERIEEILDTHGKRISEHGRQIDILMERDSEKDKRLALMQKDIESTNEAKAKKLKSWHNKMRNI